MSNKKITLLQRASNENNGAKGGTWVGPHPEYGKQTIKILRSTGRNSYVDVLMCTSLHKTRDMLKHITHSHSNSFCPS